MTSIRSRQLVPIINPPPVPRPPAAASTTAPTPLRSDDFVPRALAGRAFLRAVLSSDPNALSRRFISLVERGPQGDGLGSPLSNVNLAQAAAVLARRTTGPAGDREALATIKQQLDADQAPASAETARYLMALVDVVSMGLSEAVVPSEMERLQAIGQALQPGVFDLPRRLVGGAPVTQRLEHALRGLTPAQQLKLLATAMIDVPTRERMHDDVEAFTVLVRVTNAVVEPMAKDLMTGLSPSGHLRYELLDDLRTAAGVWLDLAQPIAF